MTARIVQFLCYGTTRLEVARQDYELARKEVRCVMERGRLWWKPDQERLMAAREREEAAWERLRRAMGNG